MPPMSPKCRLKRATRNPQPRRPLRRPGWPSEQRKRPVWSYSLGRTALGSRPIDQRRSQHVDVVGASLQSQRIICVFGGVSRVEHRRCRLRCVTKRCGGRAARAIRNRLNALSDQTMVVAVRPPCWRTYHVLGRGAERKEVQTWRRVRRRRAYRKCGETRGRIVIGATGRASRYFDTRTRYKTDTLA